MTYPPQQPGDPYGQHQPQWGQQPPPPTGGFPSQPYQGLGQPAGFPAFPGGPTPPRKSRTGLIVAIVLGVLVVVGATTTAVILVSNRNSGTAPTAAGSDTPAPATSDSPPCCTQSSGANPTGTGKTPTKADAVKVAQSYVKVFEKENRTNLFETSAAEYDGLVCKREMADIQTAYGKLDRTRASRPPDVDVRITMKDVNLTGTSGQLLYEWNQAGKVSSGSWQMVIEDGGWKVCNTDTGTSTAPTSR